MGVGGPSTLLVIKNRPINQEMVLFSLFYREKHELLRGPPG